MADNCQLAPDGKRCVYGDGTRLMCCAVHKLYKAINDLQLNIPVICQGFKEYECPTFEEETYD